jgi:hypothetical protein
MAALVITALLPFQAVAETLPPRYSCDPLGRDYGLPNPTARQCRSLVKQAHDLARDLARVSRFQVEDLKPTGGCYTFCLQRHPFLRRGL